MGSRSAWGVFWAATAALAAAGFAAVRRAVWARPVRLPPVAALAIPGAVLAATFVVALVAAPNNWDSMVYHNARVMEWWDHGSIAPWDTPIDRQVRMPPLASYFKLALLGLTGNDVFFNLVQWAFFAFSILAAAVLAARLVPPGRAGPWAALLVATIPMAVLQSTSTQNDVVVAGYVLTAAFFLSRAFAAGGAPLRDLALGGAAVGLGLATKGTVYLLAVPLLGAAAAAALGRIARMRGRERRVWAAGLGAAAALVVLPNVGFWSRNVRALGSPVGYAREVVPPSAFLTLGPGKAPALAVSQVLRSAVLQLGQLRKVGMHGGVLVAATARVHRWLGLGVDEPAISGPDPFSGAEYSPLYHEDAAPSTATFLVLVGATGVALVRSLPGRRAVLVAFASGWAAWLLVALFVRWMPWNSRLQLPALVLLAIPVAAVVSACLGRVTRAILAFLLILQALPALLLNWSRPLLGVSRSPQNPVWVQNLVPDNARRSIFATSRWEEYFRNRPGLRAEVEEVMGGVARRCGPGDVVQLVLDGEAWEYALWAGARRFAPGVRLRTGAAAPGGAAPCAIVRTKCSGQRVFCLDGPAKP